MNKLILGMVLVILVVLTVPATANEVYIFPQNSNCDTGETVTVWVMANITHSPGSMDPNKWGGFQINVTSIESIGNITEVIKDETGNPDTCDYWAWKRYGDTIWVTGAYDYPSVQLGVYKLAKLTIEGVNPGETPLAFAFEEPRKSKIFDDLGGDLPDQVWTDGTFTCGGAQTFTKSLPEGWNLISLPLDPTDNSTSAVLSSISQSAVKQYNAVTKQFEDATTMDPGTGYFVHVTSASTWEYTGAPETSTTTQLKSGLNIIGVPDCVMSVSAAMGSTDYRYAARWNATSQSYEVYNPNAPAAFHDFTTIEPGEGYFVSVLSDGALTVSCP